MTHGVDTDFLVAVEVRDHPFHEVAVALLVRLLDEGHDFALAPQTLAEFLHVVTDSKRMPCPLEMAAAIARATHWWQAAEVIRVFPDAESTSLFLDLLREHRLGRKRLLDTQLAATFRRHGIRRILSNNESDYLLFAGLEVVSFR
jgi:predicted nucleic acid-binding protein